MHNLQACNCYPRRISPGTLELCDRHGHVTMQFHQCTMDASGYRHTCVLPFHIAPASNFYNPRNGPSFRCNIDPNSPRVAIKVVRGFYGLFIFVLIIIKLSEIVSFSYRFVLVFFLGNDVWYVEFYHCWRKELLYALKCLRAV